MGDQPFSPGNRNEYLPNTVRIFIVYKDWKSFYQMKTRRFQCLG